MKTIPVKKMDKTIVPLGKKKKIEKHLYLLKTEKHSSVYNM